MDKKSKGFMLYYDDLDILSELTDEQLGILIRALAGVIKDVPPDLRIAFGIMKKKKERDEAKYFQYVESRRQNGARKKNNAPRTEAYADICDHMQSYADVCDHMPLKVKVKEKVNKEKKKEKKPSTLPALQYEQRSGSLDYLYTDLGGSSE